MGATILPANKEKIDCKKDPDQKLCEEMNNKWKIDWLDRKVRGYIDEIENKWVLVWTKKWQDVSGKSFFWKDK